MLFRRKKAKSEDRRQIFRARVLDPDHLSARIVTPAGNHLTVQVADLSMQGVGLVMPFELDPQLRPEDVVEIEISCEREGWRIKTPAQMRQTHHPDQRNIHIGFQFINTGNLYAQMEDALGLYFNRRGKIRVAPALDAQPLLRISYGGHRLTAKVHDLSASGLKAGLSHVEASVLKVGSKVGIWLTLPGAEIPLEGSGTVRHVRHVGHDDQIGIEYEQTGTLMKRHAELADYLEERLAVMNSITFIVPPKSSPPLMSSRGKVFEPDSMVEKSPSPEAEEASAAQEGPPEPLEPLPPLPGSRVARRRKSDRDATEAASVDEGNAGPEPPQDGGDDPPAGD